ncbi:MAG: NUDIX domain-containing protein [Zetaproteobacteria bacterium]|nr:MAG: NUDIX domain-containing protein [Zetaproteobacteria bacterium]
MRAIPIIGVAAILFDERRRVLLLLRENKPDIAFPDHWTLVGGHVRPGETPDRAMEREMREEIGLVPRVWPWLCYNRLDPPNTWVRQHLYYGFLHHDADIRLGEEIAYRWVPIRHLNRYRIGFRFDEPIVLLWRAQPWLAS